MTHTDTELPERDMDKSVFADILSEIDGVCPGFEAAVFYDKEGETIDYHSYLDPYDTRLVAAHLGVVAFFASQKMSGKRWGDINFMEISGTIRDSITVSMGDGLFISVMVKSGHLNRAVHRKIHAVIAKLKNEIG